MQQTTPTAFNQIAKNYYRQPVYTPEYTVETHVFVIELQQCGRIKQINWCEDCEEVHYVVQLDNHKYIEAEHGCLTSVM